MPPTLQFGLSVHPAANQVATAIQQAKLADDLGYNLVTVMDHPYNKDFLDTWTLLTWLGANTKRVHLGPNVANLPLRPPAMLAKQTASLSVLTGGRVLLPIGAGAFWPGIAAYGGPHHDGSMAYRAFKDGLAILRGLLTHTSSSYSHAGDYYQVKGIRPGPGPVADVPLWVGANGPSMLKLTGRAADGILVSITYVPPSDLPRINGLIDEGAAQAERLPTSIRRAYNLMGTIDFSQNLPAEINSKVGLVGPINFWVDTLRDLHHTHRIDTFILWPTGAEPERQIETFISEIAPAIDAN